MDPWNDIWYDRVYDMIWYDMIWYDMIWYDIWYDMIWYGMIWYDMIRYDTIRYDTIRYDTIRYDTIRYDTIRCDVMWCDVMWCDVIWCDMLLTYWRLHCTWLWYHAVWRQFQTFQKNVSLVHWYISPRLHGVSCQKMLKFVPSAVELPCLIWQCSWCCSSVSLISYFC